MRNTVHLGMAPDAAVPNFAEFSTRRRPIRAGPYRALMIFSQSKDCQSSQLRVLSELAVLPTREPAPCADPKSPVVRHDQSRDRIGGKMFTRRWPPGDILDAIEARQAKCCPDPEISIRRLGGGNDAALGKAFANFPRRMCVLDDVQVRIQGQRTRTPRQPACQNGDCRNSESHWPPSFRHGSHILLSLFQEGR